MDDRKSEINASDIRIRGEAITLSDLSTQYQQRELVGRNLQISHSTKKIYAAHLKKWIEPRWGKYTLHDIRTVEVERWLKKLERAPGTHSKIRNVMSLCCSITVAGTTSVIAILFSSFVRARSGEALQIF